MIKPILFNTQMIEAILSGKKNTTRRIVKADNDLNFMGFRMNSNTVHFGKGCCIHESFKLPYEIGDILWVRETWNICNMDIENNAITFIYKADKSEEESAVTVSVSDELYGKYDLSMAENNPEWRPSIFMPKEAARIFLKVTGVRVERLQDISHEESIKEGVSGAGEFSGLWNSTVNKKDIDKYGWNANPYVWVIEFTKCKKPQEFKLKGNL